MQAVIRAADGTVQQISFVPSHPTELTPFLFGVIAGDRIGHLRYEEGSETGGSARRYGHRRRYPCPPRPHREENAPPVGQCLGEPMGLFPAIETGSGQLFRLTPRCRHPPDARVQRGGELNEAIVGPARAPDAGSLDDLSGGATRDGDFPEPMLPLLRRESQPPAVRRKEGAVRSFGSVQPSWLSAGRSAAGRVP